VTNLERGGRLERAKLTFFVGKTLKSMAQIVSLEARSSREEGW
jgi:hypothetical protein